MVSDKDWRLCPTSDYVLLNDGKLAQIISQSVEFVQLKVAESLVIYSSADFLGQGVRNLSVNGYGLGLTFGIDYNHQDIAVDEPPEVFRSEIASIIERSVLTSHVQDIAVAFKEAASNSLDYLNCADCEGIRSVLLLQIGSSCETSVCAGV